MEISEVRNLYPHIEEGKIYFNHASNGPINNRVKNRLHEYLEERNHKMILNFDKSLVASQSAKEKLGEMINAETKNIAWSENVSNGVSNFVQGLSWEKGDRIILNDLEFPSNVYPYMNLKNYGVELDFVKTESGKVLVEDYEKLITPKTKLIAISYVQFLSCYRADIKKLGEICKSNNIIFVVDAIQGVGAVNLDVKKSNIDFMIGGSHKWFGGLQGASFFYISDELIAKVNQKNVGWTSVNDPWNLLDYNLSLRDGADRFQNGTCNMIGITALDESLNLYKEFGYQNVEKNVLDNSEYFFKKLKENGISPLLKNVERENFAGIVTVVSDNSEIVFKNLEKENIFCSLRMGQIRFSPHFYNTKEEIDKVVDVLAKI